MKFRLLFEYLIYLGVFILMFKLSESAMVNRSHEEDNEIHSENINTNNPDIKSIQFKACEDVLSWSCLKIQLLQYVERLTEREELNILPGLVIVKDNEVVESKSAEIFAEMARNYPSDPTSRFNGYIVTKLANYLQSHFIRLKLIDDNTASEVRSLSETGRSKPGKKGGLEALIAAAMVMKGTLMALALGGLALLAGKALMTALMALMLSGIVGLKSLAGGKETKNVIIAKHHSHDDGHGHGHEHSAYAGYARHIELEELNR